MDVQRELVKQIEEIREWLRNLAEDRTQPMDVKVHEALWQEIQSIDIFLEGVNYPTMTEGVSLPKLR